MTFYPFPTEVGRLPGDRTGRNDRLVRRFSAGQQLRVHLRLGEHPKPQNRPISAEVLNISIAGVSVRVARTLPVSTGAMVTIGDGDSTASCRVTYTTRTTEPDRQILGLEYVTQSDRFRLDVGGVVGALRKDRGQVIKAWHRPN
jgi:hypothetical protein